MPSLVNTVRDLDRLRQIAGVLASHGFGEVTQRTGIGSLVPRKAPEPRKPPLPLGARLRRVLEDLGPSFVKLGQIISTRPDVIPPEIIEELKRLQDDVPPDPVAAIRTQIEKELGRSIEDMFSSFDEKPLASASIAQVHRAKLRSTQGDIDVVVKVQRPGAKATLERDLEILHGIAKALERSIPEMRIYRPTRLVAEFDRAVNTELDFTLEADHLERFSNNFSAIPFAHFPRVYKEVSAKRVLTLEYLDGCKISQATDQGYDAKLIAQRAVHIMVQQIFEDGFFHADPHPGNAFVLGKKDDPIIGMIDVGMVGRLTPKMRDRTIDLMVAALREDYAGLANALLSIGRPRKKIARDAFEADVTAIAQKYLNKPLKEIAFSAFIRDLMQGVERYDVEIPAEFLMLGKSMMTIEGSAKDIYPELDLFQEIRPFFLKLAKERYSPERMTQDVLRGAMRLSAAATDLPQQLQELVDDLQQGTLSIDVRQRELRGALERLGRRIFGGLVVAALVLSGSGLIANAHPWLGALLLVSGMAYALTHALRSWWHPG